MPYYSLEAGIHEWYGITARPPLPSGVNFLAGQLIAEPLAAPLIFEVNYPKGERPRHFLGMKIPVVSAQFLDVLQSSGVDNYQLYPAVLRNGKTGSEWSDYNALNVIGVVDAVDIESSKYDTVMPGGDEVPALLNFEELVLIESKIRGALMFRLRHNRTMLIIDGKVRDQLLRRRPPEGWGITMVEIPVR